MSSSFAHYLAQYLIANESYVVCQLEPMAELQAACDILLIRTDGHSVGMVAIVDGEAQPGRSFTLSQQQVIDLGYECQKLTGTKAPVSVQIIETGLTGISAAQQQRLQSYIRHFKGITRISVTAIDVTGRKVWSPGRFGGTSFVGRQYQKLLQTGRSVEALQPPAYDMRGKPYATLALLGIIGFIYLMGALWGGSLFSGLTVPQLLDLGALNLSRLREGEYYRLVTMMFLHGGLLHLGMNGLVLWVSGSVLERLVGSAWLFTIFVLSGLAGSAFSVALNGPDVTSVGASGAIMGVVAAAFICAYRLPLIMRTQVQMNMGQVLALSILPVFFASALNIDFYSHIGGALMGGLLGWLVYEFWPRAKPQPGLQSLAITTALALLLLCVYGIYSVQQHLESPNRFAVQLASKEELTANINADDLLAKYPDDPRLYLMKAVGFMQQRKAQEAELVVREGLKRQLVLQHNFAPGLSYDMTAMLALTLRMQNKMSEANNALSPEVCEGASKNYRDMLGGLALCSSK